MAEIASLLIYGAGGHGRVIAEIAAASGIPVLGFIDADPALHGSAVLGLPVLGDEEWLFRKATGRWSVALALGDNAGRKRVAEALTSHNIQLATLISPASTISPSATLGPGTVIMPGVVVNACAAIGTGVILNTGAIVEHDVQLGDYVHVSPRAVLGGGAIVGPLTHIAIGVTVLPRVSIGARCIVGAGSVVPRSLPDDVVAFGIPARIQRSTSSQPSHPH